MASPSGIQPGPGVVVVDAGTECDYVQRLDVGRLWGVGPKSRAKLEKIGVRTVPELSAMPEEVLRAQLGEALTAQLMPCTRAR